MQNFMINIINFVKNKINSLILLIFNNPIKIAEQKIKALNNEYNESLKSLSEIKSVEITTKRTIEDKKQIASDYENQALMILKQANNGEISKDEADASAIEILKKKNIVVNEIAKLTLNLKNYNSLSKKLENKIDNLKTQISNYETDIINLKTRYNVAKSTQKINTQINEINSIENKELIQNIESEVTKEETLATIYEDMENLESDIDKEINNAIGTSYSNDIQNSLSDLKQKISVDKNENNIENINHAENNRELDIE